MEILILLFKFETHIFRIKFLRFYIAVSRVAQLGKRRKNTEEAVVHPVCVPWVQRCSLRACVGTYEQTSGRVGPDYIRFKAGHAIPPRIKPPHIEIVRKSVFSSRVLSMIKARTYIFISLTVAFLLINDTRTYIIIMYTSCSPRDR